MALQTDWKITETAMLIKNNSIRYVELETYRPTDRLTNEFTKLGSPNKIFYTKQYIWPVKGIWLGIKSKYIQYIEIKQDIFNELVIISCAVLSETIYQTFDLIFWRHCITWCSVHGQ